MNRLDLLRTRRDFLQAGGVLVVTRDPPPPLPPSPGQPPAVPANPAEGVEVLLSRRAAGRACQVVAVRCDDAANARSHLAARTQKPGIKALSR